MKSDSKGPVQDTSNSTSQDAIFELEVTTLNPTLPADVFISRVAVLIENTRLSAELGLASMSLFYWQSSKIVMTINK